MTRKRRVYGFSVRHNKGKLHLYTVNGKDGPGAVDLDPETALTLVYVLSCYLTSRMPEGGVDL